MYRATVADAARFGLDAVIQDPDGSAAATAPDIVEDAISKLSRKRKPAAFSGKARRLIGHRVSKISRSLAALKPIAPADQTGSDRMIAT